MSRLDRLGDVKDVVQIGAALGRQFSFALLAAISQAPAKELRAALRRLANADLLHCRRSGRETTCMFKHALVRDAAYATLLRSDRRTLHRTIAEVMEQGSQRLAKAEPEMLAYHLTEGNSPLKAIPLWQEAGARAASRAAHVEATSHFFAALNLLDQVEVR